MPKRKDGATIGFDERRPAFLDHLDDDPSYALESLYEYVQRFFAARPPSIYFGLPASDREDWPSRVFYHLVEDRCRRLKQYRVQDTTFAAWLSMVVRNLILSSLPKRPPPEELPPDLPDRTRGSLDPDTSLVLRSCMARLSDSCRTLVETSAQGLKPQEVCILWGLDPEREAKRISDARSHCLNELRRHMADAGYKPAISTKKVSKRSENDAGDSLSSCKGPSPGPTVGAGSLSPEDEDAS